MNKETEITNSLLLFFISEYLTTACRALLLLSCSNMFWYILLCLVFLLYAFCFLVFSFHHGLCSLSVITICLICHIAISIIVLHTGCFILHILTHILTCTFVIYIYVANIWIKEAKRKLLKTYILL